MPWGFARLAKLIDLATSSSLTAQRWTDSRLEWPSGLWHLGIHLTFHASTRRMGGALYNRAEEAASSEVSSIESYQHFGAILVY